MAVAAAAILGGCSSIVSGTSQTLTVNTNPSGADCKLTRNDLVIGRVNPTPGGVLVQKTKYNIIVTCDKVGYRKAAYINKSGVEGRHSAISSSEAELDGPSTLRQVPITNTTMQ